MARLLLCTLLALALLLSCDAIGVRAKAKARAGPVQKVLQLIDDFTAKVRLAAEESTKVFQEFARLCDDEVSTTEYAITGTKEQIVELQAAIAAGNAAVETETTKISDVTSTISAKETELSEAMSMRENEHTDFVAAEKELVDTVESLAGAQVMLKKSLALLQSNGEHLQDSDRNAIELVSGSLAQIAEAAFVTTQQREQIQAFFQMKEDAEDDLSFSEHAKAKDSGAILDTLAEMEDKASETLTKTRNDEMAAASAGALMKQGLENEIKSLKTEMAQSTQKRQAAVESTAQATSDHAVEEKTLSSDSKSLRDAKHECQDKAKEYEIQSRDTNAELTALAKAKAILSKKFSGASFVQIRSTTHALLHAKARNIELAEHRAQALRMIEQVGKKYHSTALVAFAYRAAADPFVKIRGMIEEMIEKLLQEAAEEASQKAFCDKEMGDSKKQQATKVGKIDKLSARLGEADAHVAKLMEETARLSQELADLDKNLAKATKIRNEEHAVFLESEKELSESEEACSAAISVLREYYEGAALVQVASRTRRATAGTVEEESADGSGILGILEVAESDFATSLAEVRQAEAASADEFNTLMQDTKLQKASMSMDFKGKQTELKNLKVSISENSEDKAGISEELDAVNAYLDKLKPQCETKAPSYAEVKAKREAEIQGLKDALDVLSGNGVPMGFLQRTATVQ